MALSLGFEVIVCDPREEHRASWTLDGVLLSREMPDDLILRMTPDARTAVVALTHDPKLDDLALIDALQSDAFYVGAIGSRRNSAQRRERLREHFDLSEPALQALHGPAGLFIGSKTPAEIALSIMAEVVAVNKNGVPVSALSCSNDATNARQTRTTRISAHSDHWGASRAVASPAASTRPARVASAEFSHSLGRVRSGSGAR